MKIIILLSLVILTACGGGGGGSKQSTNNPTPNVPNIPVELPDIRPTCDGPAATTAEQGAPFHAKGRRTGDDYFLICNPQQLAAINSNDEYLNRTFYLGNDIELGYYYTDVTIETFTTPAGKPGNQFVIAPDPNKPFTGVFFGDHYVISDFRYVNDNTTNLAYCGLFGYTDGASITGLQLDNLRIDANVGICGAIVGYAKNSYFSNISITSYPSEMFEPDELIFIRGLQIAGFIARLENSKVNESYSIVNLETPPSVNELLAGGLFISIYNGSEVNDTFYDGEMTLSQDTIAGAVSVYQPVDSGDFEFSPTLLSNVWHTNSKGVSAACSDDPSCSSLEVYGVNTSDTNLDVEEGGPYFFMYRNNEPLINWGLNSWWFIGEIDPETARYPWLD